MIKGRHARWSELLVLEHRGQTTTLNHFGTGKQLTKAIIQRTTMTAELNRSRAQLTISIGIHCIRINSLLFRSEKENKTVKIGGILCCSTKKSRSFPGRISVRCSLVNLPTAGFKVLSEVTLRPKNKEGHTRLAELLVRHRKYRLR